ncbi:MAG: MFS transporter [Chloroflexi bacterium HGW-Chloroflexi-8]|nr:MAG: MFS transporter [Chloroflexi bacterium HGW-Chloroflexi-8]
MTSAVLPKNMRTFSTIWIGQLISLLGSGLTGFALGVWIYQQTGKATPFAITVLFANLPPVLLGPIVGSIADRYDRKKIMLIADTGNALVTLLALVLLFTNSLQIWNIFLIVLVGSVFGAFQEPAFAASVVMLVPKKDLQRANGMAQMSNALGNLISPLLSGVLFGLIGLKGIILIDFITYFAALFTLIISKIPMPVLTEEQKNSGGWKDAMAGWRYLRAHGGLLGLVIFFAGINFMLNFATVLTSPMVLATLSPEVLGTIMTVSGLGMFLGSVLLSAWGGPKKNKIISIIGFAVLTTIGLGIAGLRANPYFIGAGFFLLLFFVPLVSGTSQSIFQTKVPLDLQGRVYAMRSMISRSIMPIAFLTAGPLADYIFEPLMAEGGALSNSLIARIIGVGPGRGIGLLFLICAFGGLVTIASVWGNKKVRRIETDIPDVIPEAGD